MSDNIPRASIHVGADKKSFSAQVSNEAERRGWDEKRYQLKNADEDKNNHYNYSRKHLNFEVVKGGKIVPLGSNPMPLHERLQHRHDELGFKPYMDASHPGQVSENSPNCVVNIIISGDHNVMHRLAFGDQVFKPEDPNVDQSQVELMQGIYDWAQDTYNFACRKWGEENVIGFCVHCDETSVHAHVLTVPVEQVKRRGRIGSIYINNENPEIELTTKEWKALPKNERCNYTKQEAAKGLVERVSYAKVWGETRHEKSEYLTQLHTDYHNEVGYKYGLERGIPYDELTEEEKRARKHKDKVTLEAERQARQAIADAQRQQAEIAEETADIIQQKDEAKKELDTAKSGFMAKIFQPGKYRKEEAEKLKESYNAGVRETLDAFIKATGLKWQGEVTAKSAGQNFRKVWDREKSLTNELKTKEGIISEKDTEIKGLNATVTRLTEEVNGLTYQLTLIDADAVKKLRDEKNAETSRANKAENELGRLRADHQSLLDQWNAINHEPEFEEATTKIYERKERKNRLIDAFIREGREELQSFARTTRLTFSEREARYIYYGIVATTAKHNLSLAGDKDVKSVIDRFLTGISWKGCTDLRKDCVSNWVYLFAVRDVGINDSVLIPFMEFVDYASGSAQAYSSCGGSNGCADQLTNWDGTKKRGLESISKKRGSLSM